MVKAKHKRLGMSLSCLSRNINTACARIFIRCSLVRYNCTKYKCTLLLGYVIVVFE